MRVYYTGPLITFLRTLWLDRRENDLWCCNQNKGLSRAFGDGCRAISKNPLLQEFQGWGQGFERGDSRFHKEICQRLLTIHLCWKAIPLADSSAWTKTLEYDLLVLVRSWGELLEKLPLDFWRKRSQRQRATFRFAQAIAQAQRPRYMLWVKCL